MATTLVIAPSQEPDRTDIGALTRTEEGDQGFPNITKWDGSTITFSFPTAETVQAYPDDPDSPTAEVLSEIAKSAVRESFKRQFEAVLPLQFLEVADTTAAQGLIRVVAGKFSGDVGGQANFPGDTSDSGDVQLGTDLGNTGSIYEELYSTVVHELGHALGLNHPGNYDEGSTPDPNAPGPFLPIAVDNVMNTIMSYNENEDDNATATTLMPYDIRALQFLYGTNTSFNNSNTTYTLRRDANDLENPAAVDMGALTLNLAGKRTIWDAGGKDTLNARTLPADSYYFDLNPGGILTAQSARNASSYAGQPGQAQAGVTYPVDSFGIRLAFDMQIEDLLGTEGNDEVVGNASDNFLFGGAGNDTIAGNDGSDILSGNQGIDVLNGGNGNDFIVGGRDNDIVSGDAGDDQIVSGNIGDDVVNGGDGNDLLVGGRDNDVLNGDAGDDTLSGDFGMDMLTGGTGADTFVLRSATATTDTAQADIVMDFEVGSDRIGLSAGAAQVLEDTTHNGISGTLIRDANAGNAILGFVNNLSSAQLADQFVSTSFT
jgi:serralysin